MIAAEPVLQRVLILADESADWRVAGLGQLHRLLLCLNEYAQNTSQRVPISVSVMWRGGSVGRIPVDARLTYLEVSASDAAAEPAEENFDLVLSTRVFLYRNAIEPLLENPNLSAPGGTSWEEGEATVRALFAASSAGSQPLPWRYLSDVSEIPACERAFLRAAGKSQDGLVSRYVNRPVSRVVTRALLKTSIVPTTWSVLIFVLPLAACVAFLQGTAVAFIVGCAIFQLYSILDGCDGEIARAKFLQTEFGRRLDSLLDLFGNVLLALSLGVGLAAQVFPARSLSWFYISEGIAAAFCVLLSEGIVFLRRSRHPQVHRPVPTALNGALYQRHNEFFQRSGILALGENVAWWVVFMTKRDMAMLAFLILAIIGWPQMILHLLLGVGAINSAFAGNAFFRTPAPALQQEAS